MITELRQPLAVRTPKGEGYAIMVVDYGPESSLLWVTVLNESGEVWAVRNEEVRVKGNWSLGAPRRSDG